MGGQSGAREVFGEGQNGLERWGWKSDGSCWGVKGLGKRWGEGRGYPTPGRC